MEEYSMFLFGNKEEKKVKKAEEKQIKEYFKNNHDIVIGGIYFNDSDKKYLSQKVFLNQENNKLSTMMI